MKKHSPDTVILLAGGVVLSAAAALAGAASLIVSAILLASARMDDWVLRGFVTGTGLGLVLVVAGIVGLRVCIRRLYGHSVMPPSFARVGPLPKPDLSSLEARVAAGLCPKCGGHVAPADQNCPSCRINLAWAREHLRELAGAETSS